MSTFRNYGSWSSRRDSSSTPSNSTSSSTVVSSSQLPRRTFRSGTVGSGSTATGPSAPAPGPPDPGPTNSTASRAGRAYERTPVPITPAVTTVRERLAAARERERKAESEASSGTGTGSRYGSSVSSTPSSTRTTTPSTTRSYNKEPSTPSRYNSTSNPTTSSRFGLSLDSYRPGAARSPRLPDITTVAFSSYRPSAYLGARSGNLSAAVTAASSGGAGVSSCSSPTSTASGCPATPVSPGASLVTMPSPEPADVVLPAWRADSSQKVEWITVVTRSTSPTAPSPSVYLRTRRADQARTIERTVKRPHEKPERAQRSAQTDDMTTHWARHTTWSPNYAPPSTTAATRLATRGARDVKDSKETSDKQTGADEINRPTPAKAVVKVGYVEPGSPTQSAQSKVTLSKADNNSQTSLLIKIPIKDFRKSALNAQLDGQDAADYTRQQKQRRDGLSTPERTESSDQLQSPKLKQSNSVANHVDQTNHSFLHHRQPKISVSTDSSESSESSESDSSSDDDESKSRIPAGSRFQRSPSKECDLKPPRPPGKGKTGQQRQLTPTEEAKSVLVRALGPVTNLFRSSQQGRLIQDPEKDSEKRGSDSGTSINKSSHLDNESSSKSGEPKVYNIRKQYSGDRPWWFDSSDNILDSALQRAPSSRSVNRADSDNKESVKSFDIRKQYSGEKFWWQESSDNASEAALQRAPSSKSIQSDKDSAKAFNVRKQYSGERFWWAGSNDNIPTVSVTSADRSDDHTPSDKVANDSDRLKHNYKMKPTDSGERAWWLNGSASSPGSTSPSQANRGVPVDDTVSSEESSISVGVLGREDAGSASPCSRVPPPPPIRTSSRPSQPSRSNRTSRPARPKHLPLFIGGHTNIDDILGSVLDNPELAVSPPPVAVEVAADQVRVHDSVAHTAVVSHRARGSRQPGPGMIQLDDVALQLYQDGELGAYLDLDASIAEQQDDLEDFHANRNNSIVLRTQLSVRVHAIIERLVTSSGRELRRALFALKQIFQEDKDLVHEFVQNSGLSCLVRVGAQVDHKYQTYILRALGQVMLYVDGMAGVMAHGPTVQWLYSLVSSPAPLVAKTALKLLLVFIEYTAGNSLLLIQAVHHVDSQDGALPWSRLVRLLGVGDRGGLDVGEMRDIPESERIELLVFALTLLNKTLAGVPDQDTYFDQVDLLEQQGMAALVRQHSQDKIHSNPDLLRQLHIYESVLQHEDGGESHRKAAGAPRNRTRQRRSIPVDLAVSMSAASERLRSSPDDSVEMTIRSPTAIRNEYNDIGGCSYCSSPLCESRPCAALTSAGGVVSTTSLGMTPALRRRRERAERQRCFQREQADMLSASKGSFLPLFSPPGAVRPAVPSPPPPQPPPLPGTAPPTMPMPVGLRFSVPEEGLTPGLTQRLANGTSGVLCDLRDNMDDLPRENSVKDLTNKLSSQNMLHSPVEDMNRANDMSGMAGIISKAKEGLAKSKAPPNCAPAPPSPPSPPAPRIKSETELHWEELVANLTRSLQLCDLDFTDLHSEDESDVLSPACAANGIPPPPPPLAILAPRAPVGGTPPPPPPTNGRSPMAPSMNGTSLSNPPVFGVSLTKRSSSHVPAAPSSLNSISRTDGPPPTNNITLPKKSKKTVKLFWKEVRDDPLVFARTQGAPMLWDELQPLDLDTQKLEHLFESRAKDIISKKQQEMNKNKEIIVLDHKRSNAINIGMTKLPPPRAIKTAILKMDATVMNREGIDKLLTMLPTEDERARIQDAQALAPDTPLGSAEQFLLTLASIAELPARLKLWAFKLDYENCEKEIAEPLMDLKQGMDTLRANYTFRAILQTLLSIGIFLNGSVVKGFQIEYLSKVPEVKDTVHKHSLLHHLCHMVMDKFPDASDLYSEIGAITRASRVDFEELAANIVRMESECKASWDRLKLVAKHDGSTMVKVKMSDFLTDCAERIIVLRVVHRRVMNRFRRFLLWVGVPLARVSDTSPSDFCRVISEFALEYRTTRERVLQQLHKKANHRERNKTRGKMITEVRKWRDGTTNSECAQDLRKDAQLREILGGQRCSPWRRPRKEERNELTDADDEILESLVLSATRTPCSRQGLGGAQARERKRTRNADRKSLRRTLKSGLSEEERSQLARLATYIKGY